MSNSKDPRAQTTGLTALVAKLPALDMTWSPDLQEMWWQCLRLAAAIIGPDRERDRLIGEVEYLSWWSV